MPDNTFGSGLTGPFGVLDQPRYGLLNEPFGSISATHESPSQRIAYGAMNALQDIGMSQYNARNLINGIGNVLGWTPLSVPTAAADLIDAQRRGDIGGAAQAALGMVPGAGKMAKEIKAFHATYEPFAHYDWSRLGKVTSANTDSEWAQNLAKIGPWASENDIASKMAAPHSLPVSIGGEGMHFKSLDELEAAVKNAGGPEEFRDMAVSKGYGHVKVDDEEFGTNSYIALAPEYFRIETAPK